MIRNRAIHLPRRAATLVAASLAMLLAPLASAHHDVSSVIAELTARIDAGDHSADLYFCRARKFRILGQADLAEADLRSAVHADPAHAPAYRELARLLAETEQPDAALAAARQAVTTSPSDSSRATSHIILARLHAQAGRPDAALLACEEAFRLRPRGNVDWFLLHAELLGTLGRTGECPGVLDAGYKSTSSIVLRNAWIDALLDASQVETALPVIEHELATSRLRSSWLLRRARARLLTGDPAGAEDDLLACLQELESRIHPTRPDLTLITDRGLANALLGRLAPARADLVRAQASGIDPWLTAPLERVLAAREE